MSTNAIHSQRKERSFCFQGPHVKSQHRTLTAPAWVTEPSLSQSLWSGALDRPWSRAPTEGAGRTGFCD